MSLNLAYFLDASAQVHASKTALILDDFRMTYAELVIAAKKVANILKDCGIKKGDKVALMIPNTPHFPIIYYGILNCGATVVPINCLLKSAEIQYQLEDSDAEVFFTWRGFLEESGKAFHQAETCRRLIVVSSIMDMEPPPVGELLMPLLLAAPSTFDMVQTMPEDTAVILYTSGTTGTPKGAELTHFNVFFNAFYAKDHIVEVRPEDVGLVALPLFHSFGQTCVMNVGLLAGATLTMMPQFDTQKAFEIIQRDDGSFADVDEVGEIVLRGHNLMKGYYKKPGATESVIIDGWFHTGDMAKMDAEGYFFIVDRKKDLIIRGGMNIYPREIEEVIYGHPDVIEVCVIGMPDPARGEEVRAYVALRKAASATAEDIRMYCQERMARYKVPREVAILPSLPKGPTGKLLKRKLREMALGASETGTLLL